MCPKYVAFVKQIGKIDVILHPLRAVSTCVQIHLCSLGAQLPGLVLGISCIFLVPSQEHSDMTSNFLMRKFPAQLVPDLKLST